MSYNSIGFIAFLFVFLLVYLAMPNVKLRQAVILVGNLVFYRYAGGVNYLIITVAISLIVYISTRLMDGVYKDYEAEKAGLALKGQHELLLAYQKKCRKYLWMGLLLTLGFLVYVKVGKWFHWEETRQLREMFRFRTVIVPLGVSYYTFSAVGYMLDVYWHKAECERNYFKLLTCVTFFPIVVQGPISRYDKLMKQFDVLPGFQYERLCYGLQLMLWGYFKKMVVADRLSLLVENVLGYYISSYAGMEILIAVLFDAVVLYADFSGCMDIVTGVAQMMGVTLDKNFEQPFFSRGAGEFWRRWHITLGAWFKDYIYMPIVMDSHFKKLTKKVRQKFGKRAGMAFSTGVPLAVVWICSGLWHGTGFDYVVWGCYWGILIIVETVFEPEFKKLTQALRIKADSFGWRLFQMLRTFFFFVVGCMMTTKGSLQGFAEIVRRLFAEPRLGVFLNGALYTLGLNQKNFWMAFVGTWLMLAADMMQEKYHVREELAKCPLLVRWGVYYGLILAVLIFGIYGPAYDARSFIYGEF